MTTWLGVDFGTSNTAAAVLADGQPQIIALESGKETVPTAMFLDFSRREILFGNPAVAALIEGREGRFMRALKRVLGTPLMHEPRQLLNKRMTLLELVAAFLSQLKTMAETETGHSFDAVLSGRPVHFHDNNPARDAAAQEDLAACYKLAGFSRVEFMFEPEAAARAAGAPDGLGLVVDIGGGTSDFTLFHAAAGKLEVLANHGIRIGGTDFDRTISLAKVMPLLGHGTDLKSEFGSKLHTAPVGLFHDLATWEKIAFLYSPENRRAATSMQRAATQPELFARLTEVLLAELGHEAAFAVEAGKIEANGGAGAINLSVIEPGLKSQLTRDDMNGLLSPYSTRIGKGAEATLAQAGLTPSALRSVVFTGGSSLLGAVHSQMKQLFPQAQIVEAGAFSAVAAGLALAAADMDN